MKRIFYLIVFLLSSVICKATHIVGGEITYTHVAGNTYEVTLTVYRDDFNGAAGAQFDDPAMVYLYDVLGNYVDEFEFDLDNPAQAALHLPNPYPNPCLTIPPNIEIQKGVYTFNITIPNGNTTYDLIYARCCRNGALINNLTNPGDQGSSFTVRIPATNTFANNSPSYNFPPPIFVCSGSPMSFDQSGVDLDGDSLYYSVCDPLQGLDAMNPVMTPFNGPPPANFGAPFTPVVWLAPFSANDPLGGVPLSIDPATGLLSGTPNTLGSFVVGICMQEYRNGTLLSTVLRDFQYTVTNCNVPTASIPIVGSIPLSQIPGNVDIPENILGIYVKNCDDLIVDFDNQSTLPGGVPATASNADYWWDFGDGTTDTLFEPSHTFPDTGTYVVQLAITIDDGSGSPCSDTGYYVVFVFPTFEPAFTVADVCLDLEASFIDISTTAVYDFVDEWDWDFGDGSAHSGLQHPLHKYNFPGTYEVILFARTDKGCTKLDTNNVTIHPLPNTNFSINPNPICLGDTTTFTNTSAISSGTIDSSFWDFGLGITGNSDTSLSYSVAGVHPIRLINTSNFGCLDTLDKVIIVNDLPVVTTSGNDTICPNTSIQVSAAGGVSYEWSPSNVLNNANIFDPIISPTVDQYYTVTVTDVNTCQNVDSLFIALKIPPPADAGEDTSVCFNNGDPIVFNTSVSLMATGGISYSWSPATGLTATNIPNPIASPLVNTEYVVTVFDAQNCSATDTVEVIVLDPNLDLIQVTTDSICIGDTVVVEVVDQGDISSYSWSPITFVTDPTANEPGFYPVVNTPYILTIQNYCYQDEDTVLIEVIPLPNVDAGPLDSICLGDAPYQLIATPNDLEIYDWTSSDMSISDPTIYNPTVSPLVSSMYYLTATDIVGTLACVNHDSVEILVYDIPSLDIQFPNNYLGFLCQGDSVILTAFTDNAIFFNWDADTSLTSLNTQITTAFPQDTSEYFVTIENTHGCINRDSITVNVQKPIDPSISVDSIMCFGSYIDLQAFGGIYYHWYPVEANYNNSSYSQTQAHLDTSMQIFVEVSNDCFYDTLSQNITVHPLPSVEAGEDFRLIRDDVSGFLDGSGGGKPLWYSNNLNFYGILNSPAQYAPEVQPEETTTYVLEIEDPMTGCKNYDTMTVFVDVITILAFPTAFTPNSDGVNDLARIIKYLNIKTLDEFTIYNRYGEIVFETRDINAAWDGTYKGVSQDNGTFVWTITATTKDDEIILKKGNISLLR